MFKPDASCREPDIRPGESAADALRRSDERYRAFIRNSSEAIWRCELDVPVSTDLPPDQLIDYFYRHGSLAECNDAMARMYGFEHCDQLVGVRLDTIMPRADPGNVAYLRAFIASGYRLTDAESHEVGKDGRQLVILNNLIGVVEDGKVMRAWGTSRDITERHRQERGARFLADASSLLAANPDYEATLAAVARLAVPAFADWCAVDLLDEAGVPRRLAEAHRDGADPAQTRCLDERYPPAVRGAEHPPAGAAHGGCDEEHRLAVDGLGPHSVVRVPLIARDRSLGAMTFVSAGSGQRYGEADVRLAEDLAARAAIAIDNARLYRAQQESETRFRSLVEQVEDYAIFMTNPAGICTSWNEGVHRVLGYTEAEFIGMPAARIFTPEAVAEGIMEREFRQAAERGSASDDRWMMRRDGRRFWASGITSGLFDQAGVLIGFTKVMRDLTAAKRAHDRLAAEHAVTLLLSEADSVEEVAPALLAALGGILGGAVSALWVHDLTTGTLRAVALLANRRDTNLPAFTRQTQDMALSRGMGLPGRVWETLRPVWVPDLQRDDSLLRRAAAFEVGLASAVAFPIHSQDEFFGVMEFFTTTPLAEEPTLTRAMSSVGVEVGHFIRRKRAELALAESEQRKSAMLESALDCVITMDEAGLIVEFNPAAERTFGYSRAEAIGRGVAEMIIPPNLRDAHYRGIERYLRTGEGVVLGKRIELPAVRADGSEIPVELAIMPIRLQGGKQFFTAYLRDITDRLNSEAEIKSRAREIEALNVRLAEANAQLQRERAGLERMVKERTVELEASVERLRLAERMAVMGTLSAGLGHDIGNLLLPVRARLDSIRGLDVPQTAHDDLDAIAKAMDYLTRMTNGLRMLALDPEARTTGDEAVDLGDWWAEMLPLFKNVLPRQAVLTADFPPGLAALISRPALTQAVFNLVQNAGDALAEQSDARVRVWADKQGANVRIGVTDNGPGMAAEVQRRAFEPFFTTKARRMSTGMGLSLVQGLIHRAGGAVEIDSELGQGTTFILTIKAAPTRQPDLPRPRALVSVKDQRYAGFVVAVLEGLKFEVARDTPTATPDHDVWITEPTVADHISRDYLTRDKKRFIFVVGGTVDSMNDQTITLPARLEPSTIRRTLGELARRLTT